MKVRSEFSSDLEKLSSDNSVLDKIRIKYLGRKGLVSALFVHMGTVSNEERPKMGQALNALKTDIENKYKVVDVVFGYSDSANGFDYPSATQNLGTVAEELNADAVINISYNQREYTGTKKVCFQDKNERRFEIFAHGTAVKFI